MTFLNPSWALLVPFIIGLIYLIFGKRRLRVELRLATAKFFASKTEGQVRTFTLIAALNALFLSALALSLTRPAIKLNKATLVIDNSLSTGFLVSAEETVLDKLKFQASSFLKKAVEGDFLIIPTCGIPKRFNSKESALQFISELSVKLCEDDISSRSWSSSGRLAFFSDKKIICENCEVVSIRAFDYRNSAITQVFWQEPAVIQLISNFGYEDELIVSTKNRQFSFPVRFTRDSLFVPLEGIDTESILEISLKDGGNNKLDNLVKRYNLNVWFEDERFNFLTKVFFKSKENSIHIVPVKRAASLNSPAVLYNPGVVEAEGFLQVIDLDLGKYFNPVKVQGLSQIQFPFEAQNARLVAQVGSLPVLFYRDKKIFWIPFDLPGNLGNPDVRIFFLNVLFDLIEKSGLNSSNFYSQYESFPDPNKEFKVSVLSSAEESLRDFSRIILRVALILGALTLLLMFK